MISAAILALLGASAAANVPAAPACDQTSPIVARVHAATASSIARCPVNGVVRVGETPQPKGLTQPAVFTTEGRQGAIEPPAGTRPIV